MGIETALPDRKGKVFCELPKETNSRSKRSRRRQRKVYPVQKLYETCKEVFSSCGAGIIPPPGDVEKLASVLTFAMRIMGLQTCPTSTRQPRIAWKCAKHNCHLSLELLLPFSLCFMASVDSHHSGFLSADSMKLEDVGLNPEMPYFRTEAPDEAPKITYLHLYECEKFSIGIFCLPPSGVIPLHNHPGMTVFSKLLFGSMHIKSYDWAVDSPCNPCNPSANADPSQIQHPGVQLAKVKVDADFTAPCNSSILYPAAGGNMHCFTALTACAVLDVLGPPYSDPEGRDCTYYFDFPFTNFSVDGVSVPEEEREGYAWLQEREKLEDFAVVGAVYDGPVIVEC